MKLELIKTIISTIIFTLFFVFVLLTCKTHASDWTPETEKKLQKMIDLGWKKDSAMYFIQKCKKSKEPANCVLIGTFISCAESSCTKKAKNNNILGIERKWKWVKFKSEKEAIDFWIGQYNKYWYKWNKPWNYYGANPITKYCFPEKKNNWGKNGLNNSTKAYNFMIK